MLQHIGNLHSTCQFHCHGESLQSRTLVQQLGHLLVGFVIIRRLNLAWYLVYLALLYILTCIKDWGAIIGAFVFLPIGSA